MNNLVVFLCSTALFVAISASHNVDSLRQSHLREKSHHVHSQDRLFSPLIPRCTWVCFNISTSNHSLEIIHKVNVSLLEIYQVGGDIALIDDYRTHILAVFNGSSGDVTVLDLRTSTVYYIKGSLHTAYNWFCSKSNFTSFSAKFTCLEDLLKLAVSRGDKCKLSDTNSAGYKQLTATFVEFGISISAEETLTLFSSLNIQLNGSLSIIYKNSTGFTIQKNLQWFLYVNLAFSDLLSDVPKNSNLSSIQYNLYAIFNSGSGVEALLELLVQIGAHADLARLFAPFLTSQERSLKLLSEVSGGSNNGLDGMITILVNIQQFVNGHGSVNVIISSITNYNSSGDDTKLYILVNKALRLAASQNRVYHNSEALKAYVNILEAINRQNLVLNGVNISDIIKLLRFYRPNESIPTIIKILSQFLPSRGIPAFFSFLVNTFNSTSNAGIISRFIPGANFSNFSGTGSILQQILHGRNITELFSHSNNITEAFSHIPVFGPIIHSIASTVGGGGNFTQYLNATTAIHGFQQFIPPPFHGIFGSIGNSSFVHGFQGIVSGIGGAFGHIFGSGNSSGGLFGSGSGNASGGFFGSGEVATEG